MRTSRRRAGLAYSVMAGCCITAGWGCAWRDRPEHMAEVYVRPDVLVSAYPARSVLDAKPPAGAPQHPTAKGQQLALPKQVQPFNVLTISRSSRQLSEDAAGDTRLSVLEDQLMRRVARYDIRQQRIDEALLTAERSEAVRALEEQAQVEWDRRRQEADRRIRDLELRLIGLRSQLRVLSPGWRDDVEADMARTLQARESVETELASSWSRYRSETLQALRNRLDDLEETLRRRREQALSRWRSEALRTLRSANVPDGASAAEMPDIQIPQIHPVSQETSRTGTLPGPQRSIPRSVPARTTATTHDEWHTTLLRETLSIAQTLATQRGWRLVTTPRQGVPDRTQEVVQMVRDFWYGKE